MKNKQLNNWNFPYPSSLEWSNDWCPSLQWTILKNYLWPIWRLRVINVHKINEQRFFSFNWHCIAYSFADGIFLIMNLHKSLPGAETEAAVFLMEAVLSTSRTSKQG